MKGRHTSVDKHLKHNILWLENLPYVEKVVLGLTEACRHRYSPGHIRFKSDVDGGIKVNAYSGNGVVDVFIRIHPISMRDTLKALLLEKFPKN